MRRLGLLLLLSTSMSLGVGMAAISETAAWPAIASGHTGFALVSHASSVASPMNNQGYIFQRMPGRGGRRCDDPVTTQDGGGCSE